MVLTQSHLHLVGMNGGGAQKRRSARLSGDANGEDERPAKKSKVNGTATTTVDTKQQDGGDQTKAATKKKRKGEILARTRVGRNVMLTDKLEYEEQAGDFAFARKTSKRKKDVKEPAQVSPEREATQKKAQPQKALIEESGPPLESTAEPAVSKSQRRKTLRRLPTTPERDGPDVRVRRSKRLSDERQAEPVPQPSPHRISHAKSHANTERSPSPARGRSVTVEKQRKKAVEPAVEEIVKIALPFADTPVQRRNKEMRKTSGDGHRRSSAGMRGKRASSVIDEGRGHGEFALVSYLLSDPDAFACRGVGIPSSRLPYSRNR
jgi:kinetochore protein Mis13/DSN1